MEGGREPLIIDDTTVHPLTHMLLPTQLGIKSFLGVPIQLEDGTLFGNICAMDEQQYSFTDKDVELLKTVAELFSYVIELEDSLLKDSLTGLKNRRYLEQFFSTIPYQSFALLFIDVDNFKSINDQYGHDIGDVVLVEIGNRLKSIARKKDIIIRLAGDEFLLILPDITRQMASDQANKVLTSFSEPITIMDKVEYLTTSIGISFYPDDGKTIDVLIKKADTAMYIAKDQGKNTINTYTTTLDTAYQQAPLEVIKGQKKVLEMVLKGVPLNEILQFLVCWVESQVEEQNCSIMLYDNEADCLVKGAVSSLPSAFTEKIQKLPIGPNIGSCGRAAFQKELTITENIATDPNWDDYRKLALENNLRSCWSIPILSPEKELLGTFAMYSSLAKTPTEEEIQFIETMGYLVSLAIERTEAVKSLGHLSSRDVLTGLYNRASFYEQMKQELHDPTAKIALLFVNIDRLKNINHSMGLSVGDLVIKETATRLKELIDRRRHKIYRIDGDEFVVLLKLEQDESPRTIAETILQSFQRPFKYEDKEFIISIRIGISLYQEGNQVEELVSKGLKALTKAKRSGNLFISDFEFNLSFDHERFMLEHDLRKAIDRNELFIVYQPQFSLNSNNVIGAEALIRWNHPEKGVLSPAVFIPLAEETGLIHSIGKWLLLTVCHQITVWNELGYNVPPISVNISPIQFESDNLINVIEDTLTLTGCDPTCLALEITESMTMDKERAGSILEHISNIGIDIILDDFGTGYSCLSYLDELPICQLKIDKSFIQNKDKSAIVKSMISMAHNLGIYVIAEGVETEEQVQILREMKCQGAQGYYFSKPTTEIEKFF